MKLLLVLSSVILIGGCASAPPTQTTTPKTAARPTPPSKPITESELGVKFYPGARLVSSGQTDKVLSANLETPDDPAKVVAFYERELGSKSDGKASLTTIEAKKGGISYVVAITSAKGVTSASIMAEKP